MFGRFPAGHSGWRTVESFEARGAFYRSLKGMGGCDGETRCNVCLPHSPEGPKLMGVAGMKQARWVVEVRLWARLVEGVETPGGLWWDVAFPPFATSASLCAVEQETLEGCSRFASAPCAR